MEDERELAFFLKSMKCEHVDETLKQGRFCFNHPNKIAQEFGCDCAEDLKEAYIGDKAISKFNMMIDNNTGEIILESIQDSSIHVPTGLFVR